MITSNFFHQSPFGFKPFTSNGQFDKQNTLKNFINITGYIPLISVITGIARVVFASTILIFSDNEKLRTLAFSHLIRATTEILCIGLVCLVADLCFYNQDKLPDSNFQKNSSSSITSSDTSSSDSDDQTEALEINSSFSSSSFDAIDSNDTSSDEQNDLEITTSLSDQTLVTISDDALEKIAKFLRSDMKFFLGFREYEKVIQEIPENDREDINAQILKCIEADIHLKFNYKGDMFTYSDFAKMLSKISQPDRSNILIHVFDLLEEIKEIRSTSDLEKLIEILVQIPQGNRLNSIKLIKNFVKIGLFNVNSFIHSSFFIKISKVQDSEIEEVINCIGMAFANNLIVDDEVNDFINSILKMPSKKEAFLEQAINLYKMLTNCDYFAGEKYRGRFGFWLGFDILEKIPKLDEHALKCIIAVLENALGMGSKKIKMLVELFGATEPQYRTLLKNLFINICVNKLKFTFNDYVSFDEMGNYDKYALENLFKKLCKLPGDESEEFLKQIFRIPEWIELSYTGSCLEGISDIPAHDLSQVVDNAFIFIDILKLDPSKTKNKKIISNFMKSIKLISPDDRSNILEYISDTTNRGKYLISDWENYITILGEIPPRERKIKYDKAWEIFKEFNKNSYENETGFINVLNSLSKVELDEWSNVIDIMNEFIEKISNNSIQINEHFIAGFIQTMQPLSQIERKQIYTQAFDLYNLAVPLFNTNLSNNFFEVNLIIGIMFSLANVISEREDIFQISKEYIHYIYQAIPKSIDQISKIDPTYRRMMYNQAIELCALAGCPYSYAFNETVALLAKYNDENRPNIIHFVSKLIEKFPQKHVSIDEIDKTIFSLSKIMPKLTNSPETDTEHFILKFIESETAIKCIGTYPWYSLKDYCEALNESLLKVVKEEREDVFNYAMDFISFKLRQNKCSNFHGYAIFDYIEIISKVRQLDRGEFYNLSICLVKICENKIEICDAYRFLRALLNATSSEWVNLVQLFEKMHLEGKDLGPNDLFFLTGLSRKPNAIRKIGFAILQKFIETIKINPNQGLSKAFGGLKDNDFKVFKQLARDYQISVGRELQIGFQDNQSVFHKDGMIEDIFYPIYQKLHALLEEQFLVVKEIAKDL